jgi:uncharacterized Zn finger protein
MIPFDFDDQDEPASSPKGDAETDRASGRRASRVTRGGAADVGPRDVDDAEDENPWNDDDDDDADWDEDEDVADAWPASADARTASGSGAGHDPVSAGSGALQQIHQHLLELSKDELIAFVERLATQDATIRQALMEQVANVRGPTADLLRGARVTIDTISAEAIYDGDEPSNGEIARLRDRFEALVERGRADDVLMLCQRLLRHANRAVEAMHETDDGFFMTIHRVLEVIPEALARSSKGPVEQLLWLYEVELSEDYDLLPDMADFWDQDRPVEVWNELAAHIEQRLAASVPDPSTPASLPGRHRARDMWASLLADALRNAGRGDEIVQLYEREAEATGSYQRLVTHLLDVDDLERAEHWIRRGIAATPEQLYGKASQLRQALRTIRERQSDREGIAAIDAYEFCSQPGLKTFQTLLASAEAAGRRDPVRLHALRFLETLILPWKRQAAENAAPASSGVTVDDSGAASEDATVDLPPWPLSPTGLPDPVPYGREQPPLARVLLDIALAESRLDDVLVWFDRLRARQSGGFYYGDPSASVARAVERSHPDRAIAIWDDLAARAIAQTKTDAYLEGARYLENAGRIEERRGSLAAWRARILELQARERRKWRLREILDDLLKRFPPA